MNCEILNKKCPNRRNKMTQLSVKNAYRTSKNEGTNQEKCQYSQFNLDISQYSITRPNLYRYISTPKINQSEKSISIHNNNTSKYRKAQKSAWHSFKCQQKMYRYIIHAASTKCKPTSSIRVPLPILLITDFFHFLLLTFLLSIFLMPASLLSAAWRPLSWR